MNRYILPSIVIQISSKYKYFHLALSVPQQFSTSGQSAPTTAFHRTIEVLRSAPSLSPCRIDYSLILFSVPRYRLPPRPGPTKVRHCAACSVPCPSAQSAVSRYHTIGSQRAFEIKIYKTWQTQQPLPSRAAVSSLYSLERQLLERCVAQSINLSRHPHHTSDMPQASEGRAAVPAHSTTTLIATSFA
jgi:hypothetical protein